MWFHELPAVVIGAIAARFDSERTELRNRRAECITEHQQGNVPALRSRAAIWAGMAEAVSKGFHVGFFIASLWWAGFICVSLPLILKKKR